MSDFQTTPEELWLLNSTQRGLLQSGEMKTGDSDDTYCWETIPYLEIQI